MPAPMVKFLPGVPAALIESIAGQVHDVEGIHDRPRAGEFFGGCALKAGESIHRNEIEHALSMRSRHVSDWEASQVVKTFLDRPGTMSISGSS